MKILIDAVLFQFLEPGSAEWREYARNVQTLVDMAKALGLRVVILDRGEVAPVDDADVVGFPSYHNRSAATDSVLLQRLCDSLSVEAFVSTWFTMPVSTPTLQWVTPVSVALLTSDKQNLIQAKECEMALGLASFIICATQATERNLKSYFLDCSVWQNRVRIAPQALDPSETAALTTSAATQILDLTIQAAKNKHSSNFIQKWKALRWIQAAVEIG